MRKVLLLTGALVAGMLLILCANDLRTQRPVRDCPIEDLLLDTIPFPPGAVAEDPLIPAPEGPPESAAIEVGWSDGFVTHEVHRIRSAHVAARAFGSRERRFSLARDEPPWETPDVLRYRSPIADRYRVACQKGSAYGYFCIMIAQYEEYYVELIARVTPDTTTLQVVERVLQAIDERMARCLDKPLPTARVRTATK